MYIFSGSHVIAECDNGATATLPSREYIYSGGQLLASTSDAISNGFEGGLSGWSTWGPGITAQLITDSTRAHSGNNYLLLSNSTVGQSGAVDSQHVPVSLGQTITAGGWVYKESGDGNYSARWVAMVYATNGSAALQPPDNFTFQTWVYQVATYTVPSWITCPCYVQMNVELNTGALANVARFDDGFINTGTIYYHADHLSMRLATDSNGAVAGQQGHFPFGETWYGTGTSSKWKFTTYERDDESGNDYAMARYNISRLGRFSSPDPLDGSFDNPQSLNRYTYVSDDPIDSVDPSGLFENVPPGCFASPGKPGQVICPIPWIINIGDYRGNYRRFTVAEWDDIHGRGEIPGGGGPLNLPIAQPRDPCPGVRGTNPAADRFVRTNLDAANAVASQLDTTPANILGLSSVESGNGQSNLARNYNNYFGLTYPFPGTGDPYVSPNGYKYSTFSAPGFLNSALSFARSRQGTKVSGITSPLGFAQALTMPPMAFNSEVPDRTPVYASRINLVQNLIDCVDRK